MFRLALASLVLLAGCRIESAAPASSAAVTNDGTLRGDLWVYTSMYRHVMDAFDPLLKERMGMYQ